MTRVGIAGFFRRLATSLCRMALSILILTLLLLHFWQVSPREYFTGLVDDIFDHASPEARDSFAEKFLSRCDAASTPGGIAASLFGEFQGALSRGGSEGGGGDGEGAATPEQEASVAALFELCSNESKYAELEKQCAWFDENPAAVRMPPGMTPLFGSGLDSVGKMREGCAALSSGELEKGCSSVRGFSEGAGLGSVISALEETCAAYTSGGLTRDQAGRALITGMIIDVAGKDLGLGEIPDLIADADVPKDSRASRLLSFFAKAAGAFERLRASLPLHLALILALLGFMALINIHHPDYLIRKVSFMLMGPGIAILLPFGVVKAAALFMRLDTSPFFLAFSGIEEFAKNLVPFVANIMPFIVLRTFTAGILVAAGALFAAGLCLRVFGLAALRLWKEEREGAKKEQREKEQKEPEKKGEPEKEIPKEKEETEKGKFPEMPVQKPDGKALEAAAPAAEAEEKPEDEHEERPPQAEKEEEQEQHEERQEGKESAKTKANKAERTKRRKGKPGK